MSCEFGLYMVYNSEFDKEKLILGQEFIMRYDLSMNFGKEKIGFHGYMTPAPKEYKPADDGNG